MYKKKKYQQRTQRRDKKPPVMLVKISFSSIVALFLFRSFFDLFQHDSYLGNEQHGEDSGKKPESSLYSGRLDTRHCRKRGHNVLYDPRLPPHLGHYPTRFETDIAQRQRKQEYPQQPCVRSNAFTIRKNENNNKKQKKIHSQKHHDVKRIKYQRHIRYKLRQVGYVTVAEMREIFFQNQTRLIGGLLIARFTGLLVIGQCPYCRFPRSIRSSADRATTSSPFSFTSV